MGVYTLTGIEARSGFVLWGVSDGSLTPGYTGAGSSASTGFLNGIVGLQNDPYSDYPSSNIYESIASFDTSAIPAGETITGAYLRIYAISGGTATSVPDLYLDIYNYPGFSGAPIASDYRNTAALNAMDRFLSYYTGASEESWNRMYQNDGSVYNDLPLDTAKLSLINKSGYTNFAFVDHRMITPQPSIDTTNRAFGLWRPDALTYPKLVVTTAASAPPAAATQFFEFF